VNKAYIRNWDIILQDVQLQPDVSDRAGCCGGGLWMVTKELWKTNAPQVFLLVGAPQATYERPSKASRSRCLCLQTLMPVLSALSTLKPSIDRLLVGCMHVVSLATKSGVVVSSWEPWASGGLLLGSKCQSRHVGASTNRLVGNAAGWLAVVEGKKQLAERSENRRPRWLSFILSIVMDEARQWD
jgi:hypothetical protein